MLGYELDGVICDVEMTGEFDDECLGTIKRVREALDCSVKQTKDGDIVHNSEQPTQRNFCERCGKRASKDPYHIHTCTPPQALKEKNHVS
jgi:hypothetical protein